MNSHHISLILPKEDETFSPSLQLVSKNFPFSLFPSLRHNHSQIWCIQHTKKEYLKQSNLVKTKKTQTIC
jgi:hypothetical protein